ncbi:MAG: outer membrane beta-barrel protein [Proteiniphilum sp.]|jgi:hypothetical protein|nr:outer membrane beta-barrel protein [Proteiniphilum sp.]
MRKKITPLLTLLFLLPAVQSAQAQQKFTVGIQGGLGGAFTENRYTGGNAYTTDMLLGIPKVYPVWSHMYNLYLSYGISNDFRIAFEPGVIRKGYGSKKIQEERTVIFERRELDYLQLPLLLEFSPDESLRFTAGPELGYLLKGKMRETHGSGPSALTDLPENKRYSLGIQIGGSYTLIKHLDVGLKIGASFIGGDKYYLTNDNGEVLTKVARENCYINSFVRVKL